MKKTLSVLGLTLIFLVLMDFGVARVLGWAERTGRIGSLVEYFEYGRSVPGKHSRWEATPGAKNNLYEVAWRPDVLALSANRFAEQAENSIAIRTYGMSFVNNIMRPAADLRPDLLLDIHAGPAAPPNYTYAVFEEDRPNRRPGDVVVLGVLSSSVAAMASMSNSTWLFEQPAPYTYPVYWPEGDGLRRVDPKVTSADDQRAISQDPAARRAWWRQLSAEDQFYGPQTFGLAALDASPFARLSRRSLAKGHIEARTEDVLRGGAYPYEEVLRRMITAFAETARADGQHPIVLLIQSNRPRDPDVLAISRPALEAGEIPYFATAEHFDPRDPSGFRPDGHYKPRIDKMFAERIQALLPGQ